MRNYNNIKLLLTSKLKGREGEKGEGKGMSEKRINGKDEMERMEHNNIK
jgi:hypothetical protein